MHFGSLGRSSRWRLLWGGGRARQWVLFTDQIEALFGEIGYTNPVFILAVWSPGIAGVWLVWRHYGAAGVRSP